MCVAILKMSAISYFLKSFCSFFPVLNSLILKCKSLFNLVTLSSVNNMAFHASATAHTKWQRQCTTCSVHSFIRGARAYEVTFFWPIIAVLPDRSAQPKSICKFCRQVARIQAKKRQRPACLCLYESKPSNGHSLN